MIESGSPAPDFTLQSDEGQPVSLKSLRGRPVVLFWYPKADTSGCTIEACEFRDDFPRFEGFFQGSFSCPQEKHQTTELKEQPDKKGFPQ